jgi:hypothetical protein
MATSYRSAGLIALFVLLGLASGCDKFLHVRGRITHPTGQLADDVCEVTLRSADSLSVLSSRSTSDDFDLVTTGSRIEYVVTVECAGREVFRSKRFRYRDLPELMKASRVLDLGEVPAGGAADDGG